MKRPRTELIFSTLMACWLLTGTHVGGQMGKPEVDQLRSNRYQETDFAIGSGYEPELNSVELSMLEKIDLVSQSNLEHSAVMLEELVSGEIPTSPAFNHALGNVFVRLHRYREASAQFEIAVKRFRNFRRAWNDLGSLRFLTDDYKEAVDALSRSIELGASYSSTYGMMGYCYLQLGSYAAAEAAYNLALVRDADNIDWLEGKAQVLIEMEKYSEAGAHLRELIQRDPENVQYWLLQANNKLRMEEHLAAARCLEIARRIDDIDSDALFLLGKDCGDDKENEKDKNTINHGRKINLNIFLDFLVQGIF